MSGYKLANKWLSMAADAGNNMAQYYLGLIYEQGLGVAKNTNSAITWYKQSATQGNRYAQKRLDHLLSQTDYN